MYIRVVFFFFSFLFLQPILQLCSYRCSVPTDPIVWLVTELLIDTYSAANYVEVVRPKRASFGQGRDIGYISLHT